MSDFRSKCSICGKRIRVQVGTKKRRCVQCDFADLAMKTKRVAGLPGPELECELRELVAACELWAGDDLDDPHLPRRVARALIPARAALAGLPGPEAT